MIFLRLEHEPPEAPHTSLRCADCARMGHIADARLAELQPPLVALCLCAWCFDLRELGGM